MTQEQLEEEAKGRFAILNIVRITGVAFVMMGIANALGRLLPDFGPYLGYLLIGIGMFEFFFLPKMLVRGWKNADKTKENAGIS
jgi:hypothetical protein